MKLTRAGDRPSQIPIAKFDPTLSAPRAASRGSFLLAFILRCDRDLEPGLSSATIVDRNIACRSDSGRYSTGPPSGSNPTPQPSALAIDRSQLDVPLTSAQSSGYSSITDQRCVPVIWLLPADRVATFNRFLPFKLATRLSSQQHFQGRKPARLKQDGERNTRHQFHPQNAWR